MILAFLKIYALILIVECFHIFVIVLYMNNAAFNWGDVFPKNVPLQIGLGLIALIGAVCTQAKGSR
jgi:hypothetical protein